MAKIFMLMDDPRISTGYAQTNKLSIKEFTKRGHECIGFSFNGIKKDGFFENTKIISHEAIKNDQNSMLYGDKDFLLRKIKEEDPDILFFHNDFYRMNWFFELPENIKKKSIWWIPLDILSKTNFFDFLRNIENLFFVTNHAKNLTGILNSKVINHAIDESYFNYPFCDRSEKFTICRVDRHQPRKQWPYAIHAYSIFCNNIKNINFLAKCNPKDQLGFDPDTLDFIDLELFSQAYGIKDKILFFKDYMSINSIIDNIYNKSHVFLTTSGSEGFGLGVVEAMARGVVPIYPEGSSFLEIVGECGYSYPYLNYRICRSMNTEYGRPDVNQISEILNLAHNDYINDHLIEKSTECKRRCNNMFHPKIIYDRWEHEISKILKNGEINIKYKYSIIIVSKNNFNILEECIKSIIEKTKEDYEIILVDNCSDFENQEKYKKLSIDNRLKLIENNEENGFAYANNLGIKQAIGDFIILLNNDTIILNNNWISIMKECMEKENADLIGPSKCWFAIYKNKIPFKLHKHIYLNENLKTYCCDFTGFWFVLGKSSLFKEYRLNENIKEYNGDDVDFCLKMIENGKKWTYLKNEYSDGKNLVFHHGERSIKEFKLERSMNDFLKSWEDKITISIPTKNREQSLYRLLKSLMNQTYTNWDLLICNDGEDFNDKFLLKIIDDISKIKSVKIIKGISRGPMYAHELLWKNAETEWIYRVDDDNILDSQCLEFLVYSIEENIGAIAPLVLSPDYNTIEKTSPPLVKINDFLSAATVQQRKWETDQLIPAEHLHSSFLYRRSIAKEIGGFIYNTLCSNVSYGEETIFTYKVSKKMKMFINQNAITYHYQEKNGGTRNNNDIISYFENIKSDKQLYEIEIKKLINE